MDTNYFDLIQQGGMVMILLGICSIIALAIILERLYNTRQSRFIDNYLFSSLIDSVTEKKQDITDELLSKDKFFLASHFKSIRQQVNDSVTLIQQTIENSLSQVNEMQEERLHVLPFIIQLAPLLGILGTVIGLTDAFLSLGEMSGGEKFQFLAQGIGKALGTTIAGLVIAVFAMAGHYLLKYRNIKVAARIKKQLELFSETCRQSL